MFRHFACPDSASKAHCYLRQISLSLCTSSPGHQREVLAQGCGVSQGFPRFRALAGVARGPGSGLWGLSRFSAISSPGHYVGVLKGLCAIEVFCDFEPWPLTRGQHGLCTIKVFRGNSSPGHYREILGLATTPRSGPPPQEQTPWGLPMHTDRDRETDRHTHTRT